MAFRGIANKKVNREVSKVERDELIGSHSMNRRFDRVLLIRQMAIYAGAAMACVLRPEFRIGRSTLRRKLQEYDITLNR